MTSPNRPFPDVVVLERDDVVGDDAWLDTRQAAAYLSVSVSTIRKACREDLRHVRLGRVNGRILTRTEWVDAWMMQGVQEPALD